VRLWWSDPTLSFAKASPVGHTPLVVPPGGVPVQTGEFLVTIPEGASAHVCLLAQVSAPLDGASSVPDPHGDRHWAQLNLVEVTKISADGTVVVPVLLANPFEQPMRSAVALETMSRDAANHLGQLRGVDIRVDVDGIEAQMRDADGTDVRDTELRGHETQSGEVTLRFSDPPGRGAPHGLVLAQRLTSNGDESALTRTLGVVVAAD
jgi:hypothetical protein